MRKRWFFSEWLILFIILNMGILLAFLSPFILWFLQIIISYPNIYVAVIISLLLIGFLLFFKAKYPSIKQGKIFGFGTKGMSSRERVFYISGYILMLLAAVLSLILIICSFLIQNAQ
jgi:hypothetical protein